MLDVGVVIPTLNEAERLPGLLRDLREVDVPLRIVVADGGSRDGTPVVAEAAGARVVCSPLGRGRQMNAGAQGLTTRWLCFVHADTRLGPMARDDLVRTVTDPQAVAAVWRLRIGASGWWYRIVEFGAALRDRLLRLPYGDQGLLIRRDLFEAIGGFADIPVMEDVAMVRVLRRRGTVRRLSSSVVVSARRWQREGVFTTSARNVALIGAYLAGVPPTRLARWYRPETAE